MKAKSNIHRFLAALGASIITISTATAQIDGSWNSANSGVWSDPDNWLTDPTDQIPGGAGSTVNLDFAIAGACTVTIDTDSRTVGILNIGLEGNTNRWTLAASGDASLTFDNNSNGAVINFFDGPGTSGGNFGGASEISAPVTLADNLSIDSAKLLRISGDIIESGGARSIAVNGGLILEGENTFTGGVALESGDLRFTNAGKDANNVVYSLGSGTLTVEGGQLGFQHGQTHIIENEVVLKGNFNAYRGVTGTTTWQQDGDVTLEANVQANSPNGTMNWVVNGSISGDHSLEISGNTMNTSLNAANTFSGGFIHSASGTLRINHEEALGTGTLSFGGGNVNATRTIDNTSVGAIALSNKNALNLNRNLSFTGSNDLNFGTGAVTLQSANRTITVEAGTLTFGGAVGQDSSGRQLTKAGVGTLVLGGANTYSGTTNLSAGTIELRGGDSNLTQTLAGLNFNSAEATLVSNKAGTGSLDTTFAAPGRSAGATGNIIVQGGSNGIDNIVNLSGAQGFVNAGIFFNGADFAARNDTDGHVRGLAYGTDPDTAAVDTVTADEHVKITGSYSDEGLALRSLNLAGSGVGWTNTSGNLTVPGILKSGGGATATISGGEVTTAANAELVIRTDTSGDNLTIESDLTQGSGRLTKSGAGTLALNGENTYTGATNVNAGKLLINGNNTNDSTVNVRAGATLGGTGTSGGAVSVAAGGGLEFDISTASASHDGFALAEDRNLTINNPSTLTITSSGGGAIGEYILVSCSGTGTVSAVPSTIILPSGWEATVTRENSNSQLVLNVTSTGSATTPYEDWSDGAPFDGDASGDGVSNGMAFLLGAANPNASALGLLPAVSEDTGGLVLTFSMLNAANRGDSTLSVEYSNDLGDTDPWAAAEVPETSDTVNDVVFTITPNGSLNDVTATIPASKAAGGKLFGRLKAEE